MTAFYASIQQNFQQRYKEKDEVYRRRLAEWRREPPVVSIKKPTNIARARTVGYKAKENIEVFRVRVRKGKRKRKNPGAGRKPSKQGSFMSRAVSLQTIAEQRAVKRLPHAVVVGSYYVGHDGTNEFYEVILKRSDDKERE